MVFHIFQIISFRNTNPLKTKVPQKNWDIQPSFKNNTVNVLPYSSWNELYNQIPN